MTPMKLSAEARKRAGNTSSSQWKRDKAKKYSIPSARVIKAAGNDYRVVHISLIMAVGVAEVVWVTATYFI